METIKIYYGLIGGSYGFVDSDDERSKQDGMIELTEDEHQQLLEEQSKGKEIVCYEGRVFTAPLGLYYLDENKIWHKKDEEEYERELLEQSKERKKEEATSKAYEYINDGGALYELEKGIHIEATDGNISKLGLAAVELVLNQDSESTIEWCSAEDKVLNLNAVNLQKVVQGLKAEQSRVWVELFPEFLNRIESAKTVKELKSINIDYKVLNSAKLNKMI